MPGFLRWDELIVDDVSRVFLCGQKGKYLDGFRASRIDLL